MQDNKKYLGSSGVSILYKKIQELILYIRTKLDDKADKIDVPKEISDDVADSILDRIEGDAEESFPEALENIRSSIDQKVSSVKVAGVELAKGEDGSVNVPTMSFTDKGVAKLYDGGGLRVNSEGFLTGITYTGATYTSRTNPTVITKGTLESVLSDKEVKWVEHRFTVTEDTGLITVDLERRKPLAVFVHCYMPANPTKDDSFFVKFGGNSGCVGRFIVSSKTDDRRGMCFCEYVDGAWFSLNAYQNTTINGLDGQKSYAPMTMASSNVAVCSNDMPSFFLNSIDGAPINAGTEIFIKYMYK